MKVELYTSYSSYLKRDMTFKTYGETGKLCYVFPSQDGRYYDYENFGMVEVLKPYIESGRLRLICVDGIDKESWSGFMLDNRERSEKQEAYFSYITLELYPYVAKITGNHEKALVTGCSMGAIHSAIAFFRRPDLFDQIIALSGGYEACHFFGSYMDEILYHNSVITFLTNMPKDHPYIEMYNNSQIIICVGQGAWEEDLLASTRKLDVLLREKGIRAWVDYWGYDVCHDWCWWRKQIVYFMEFALNKKSA